MSIFPFRKGEWHTVRDLREAAAEILKRTASDEEFAAAMRVPELQALSLVKILDGGDFPLLAAGYRTRPFGRRRLQMDAGRRG